MSTSEAEIACISIHFVVILFIKSKDKNHILCSLEGLSTKPE